MTRGGAFMVTALKGSIQAWSSEKITEGDLRLELSQLRSDRPVFFGTFLVQGAQITRE